MPKSERMDIGGFFEDVARAYIRYRDGKRSVAEGQSASTEEDAFSRTERFEYDETMSNYDDARPIERTRGSFAEFLGECGMEAFGLSAGHDTRKARAMGLWLFDKDDIRTGTIVLVPEKLSDKDPRKVPLLGRGEIYVVEEGSYLPPLIFSGLTMTVKIVEADFGEDLEFGERYFRKLVAEVTVSPTTYN